MFTIHIASLHIEISIRNEHLKKSKLTKLIKAIEVEKDIEATRLKHALPTRFV